MATNVNAPGNNVSLQLYMARAVTAGNVSGFSYPDPNVCQFVSACVTAGHSAGINGAPSLEVAEMMFAILGG